MFLGYILARLCKEIRHLAYGYVRDHGSVTDKADERTREASVPLGQGGEETAARRASRAAPACSARPSGHVRRPRARRWTREPRVRRPPPEAKKVTPTGAQALESNGSSTVPDLMAVWAKLTRRLVFLRGPPGKEC